MELWKIWTNRVTDFIASVMLTAMVGAASMASLETSGLEQITPPQSVVIVVPPGAGVENTTIICDAIVDIAIGLNLPPTIYVFDGLTTRLICEIEIDGKGSDRIKKRNVLAKLKTLKDHQSGHQAIRAGEGNRIDLPSMLSTIGASVRQGGQSTRVIAFGSLFYQSENNPEASFTPGFVPSPGSFLAPSYQSVYGTSDRHGLLEGVTIDLVTLGERVGAVQERAVVNFYAAMVSELGGQLGSVEAFPDVVVDRVIAGTTDGISFPPIDRTDTAIEIRPVTVQPPPVPVPVVVPVPVEPDPEPTPEEPTADRPAEVIGATIVLVIDGTSSQEHFLPKVAELLLRVAEIGATAGDYLELGVVIYRSAGAFDVFPLTEIERGEESVGISALRAFTTEPVRVVSVVHDASGEQGGTPTGRTRAVTAIDPLLGYADLEGGIRDGLAMLDSSHTTRKILIIAGDVATYESDLDPKTISDRDLASAGRIQSMLADFLASCPEARIATLFTGPESGPHLHRDETIAQFREFAGVAGRNGTSTDRLSDIERIVVRGVLRD